MDFQMTYRLIQQTPLIHFQHDQKGATLRATEVKPKLDRFIIEKMGGKDKVPTKWFIGDTKALDYKMRIVAEGEPKKSNTIELTLKKSKETDNRKKKALDQEIKSNINGMYFGNMVSAKGSDYEDAVKESYKESVFYQAREQIQLSIICFIEDLKELIEEYIEEFFFVNNFGTRQSKGFGGFTAIKLVDGKEEKGKDPIETLSEKGYRFFYAEVNGDSSAMLNHAKNVYAVMKGGYNHTKFDSPESYVKGYIQRYFIDDYIDENTGSDKAFIKKYKRKLTPEPSREKYDDFIFSRALLGLADYFEFRDEVRKGRVEIFSLGEKGFDVERFRSPVTVKVIGNKLVFLFGKFDAICGKTFYFAPNPEGLDKNFNSLTYEQKKKQILENVNKTDRYGNTLIVPIQTIKKFDDEDVIFFINVFCEYFMEERYKLGKFRRDETIRISSNLELIVPKHIERSF